VAGKNLDSEQLLHVIAAHPELLQRPNRDPRGQSRARQASRKSCEVRDQVGGCDCGELGLDE
jgi:arsenate reductase-like glutaredoxin family protein